MNDRELMEMALELARKGEGYTAPNPMVGAVVVKEGKIVGKGFHEKVGGPHAEVNALRDAGHASKGATLYVTLEPCNHTGRTPPCTEAVIKAGVRRVVVAMEDPNPGVNGGGNDYLMSQGLRVETGLCRAEAEEVNRFFIKHVRTGRPYVLVKCAATLDGRIATATGDSKWVTGERSREYVHRLRHGMDGIMVGIETVKKDDPSLTTRLTVRLPHGPGRDPIRIILDSKLSISPAAKVLNLRSDAKTLIVAGEGVSSEKVSLIEAKGAEVLFSHITRTGRIALDPLMDRLGAMGITSLLIEGGGRVIAGAFAAGIPDRINFFYAPKILGGEGISICGGIGPQLMEEAIPVKNIQVFRFDDDVMIQGDL